MVSRRQLLLGHFDVADLVGRQAEWTPHGSGHRRRGDGVQLGRLRGADAVDVRRGGGVGQVVGFGDRLQGLRQAIALAVAVVLVAIEEAGVLIQVVDGGLGERQLVWWDHERLAHQTAELNVLDLDRFGA